MKKKFIKILKVSSLTAVFAVGFLSASFTNAQLAQPAVPACPFTSSDGTVVIFPYARLVSGDPSNWGGAANSIYNSFDVSTSLSSGTYTVKTFSWDGYPERVSVSQPNEQWNVEAYNGSTLLGNVGPTTDLADNIIEDSKTNTFTDGLNMAQSVDKIRVVHSYLTGDATPNSVVPICAAFKKKVTDGGLIVEFEKDPLFKEGDFKPGDTVNRWIRVTNNTSSTRRIAIEAVHITDADNFSEKLHLTIKEGSTVIFSDTLKKFFDQGETYLSSLGSGASTQYDLSVYFDIDAGNEYQEKTMGFDIVVGFEGEEGGQPLPPPGGGVGGGSGWGGNGPPRGLSISNEAIVDAQDVSVTISWNTSYNATSQVVYGSETEKHVLDLTDNAGSPPKYGYEHTTPETDVAMKILNHSVTITGLTPGTKYYFRAVSHGSLAISMEHSFTTLTPGQAASKAAGMPVNKVVMEDTLTEGGYSSDSSGSYYDESGSGAGTGGAQSNEKEDNGIYSMDFSETREPVGVAGMFGLIGDFFGSTAGIIFLIILLIIIFLIILWAMKRRKKDSELQQ